MTKRVKFKAVVDIECNHLTCGPCPFLSDNIFKGFPGKILSGTCIAFPQADDPGPTGRGDFYRHDYCMVDAPESLIRSSKEGMK